nr:glycosyltransferase family 4 protein [uncultured Rhodococcus sp.]
MTPRRPQLIKIGSRKAKPPADLIRSRHHALLILHSSDDIYGADRVVDRVAKLAVASERVSVNVWRPTDLGPSSRSLVGRNRIPGLTEESVPFPVLRRANMTIFGIFKLLKMLPQTVERMRRQQFSSVYIGTSACLLVAPVARILRIRKVTLHLQENWVGLEGRLLGILGLACTDIICISENTKNQLPSRLQKRAVVVLNGMAAPAPADIQSDPPARIDEKLSFVVASRWNSWKGHETLLAAWSIAAGPHQLFILGGPPKSGTHVDVRALVSKLPNPENVTVIGEVPDVLPYFASADVVIVPSDEPEPFGLVAIEAFSLGRPVIGSNGGGLAEIIDNNENGWLYEIKDVNSLAKVIHSLNLEQVLRCGENARDKFESKYELAAFETGILTVLGFRHTNTILVDSDGRTS